jgi:osmotically-inducible protein OsmY
MEETTMNIRPYLLALGLASAVCVVGCDRTPDTADSDVNASSTADNMANETKDAANNAANETQQAANTVGEKVDDGVLTTKVKAALLADDIVKGLDINVDSQNGTVSLKGSVESQTQVDRAVEVAKGIEGVQNVDNQLVVNAAE